MRSRREAGLVELPVISHKHNGALDAIQEEAIAQVYSEDEYPNAANISGANSIMDMSSPNKDNGDGQPNQTPGGNNFEE